MPLNHPFSDRLTRGSTLAVVLLVTLISAVTLLGMGQMITQHQRIGIRKYELSRAYYAAEAGVSMVQHWGNFSNQFTVDTTLFHRVVPPANTDENGLVSVVGQPEEMFPILATRLNLGNITISAANLTSMNVGTFNSQYSYKASNIQQIQLQKGSASDPVSCFFKIVSLGRSNRGIERTVVAYMDISSILTLRLPAALISFNTAAAFGNAKIHWGEAWSRMEFDMPNRSDMSYLSPTSANYDQWAKYRTEASIDFPNSWKWGLGQDLFNPASPTPGAAPASGEFALAFQQHLPVGILKWPVFDYQTFKDQAKAHGRYYSTDASGNIYRNGIETAANKVDFLTEFGQANRDSMPHDFIFIDTIDGNAPAANGSNLATISVSGNSLGLKGIYYIGANYNGSGVGSPPSLGTAKRPDNTAVSLEKIFLDGVMYTAGTLELGGNAGVYGSIVAQRGFTGGGTPDVYYNPDLANGLVIDNGNAGSIFRVAMQKNY